MTVLEESKPLTVVAVAAHFDVSRQTIYTWRDEGMPLDTHDLALMEGWVSRNHPPESAEDVKKKIQLARLDKTKAEAEALQIDNRVKYGELLSRSQVVQEWAELLSVAKPLLESMIDEFGKSAPESLRVSARELARHHVHLFLRKLATWRPPRAGD